MNPSTNLRGLGQDLGAKLLTAKVRSAYCVVDPLTQVIDVLLEFHPWRHGEDVRKAAHVTLYVRIARQNAPSHQRSARVTHRGDRKPTVAQSLLKFHT